MPDDDRLPLLSERWDEYKKATELRFWCHASALQRMQLLRGFIPEAQWLAGEHTFQEFQGLSKILSCKGQRTKQEFRD